MSRPFNPYIAGNPIRGHSTLFGRQDILDWVSTELENPNNNAITLFGQRRIGKTSLLLTLERTLPKEKYLPIFFDLQDQALRPLGEVVSDLAEVISHKANFKQHDFNQADDKVDYFFNQFLPVLKKSLSKNCRLVLLFDEFDVLDKSEEIRFPGEIAARSFFSFLRRLMTEYPSLAIIFAIGRRTEDLSLNILSLFKSALFREVWVLNRKGAEALIRLAETNNTLSFSESAIDRIISLTNGHPFLTQLLCQRLWEKTYTTLSDTPPIIDARHVESAVSDALETGSAALYWLWDGLAPVEKIYASALAEATEEGQTISESRIVDILTENDIRLRAREIELAPRDLVMRRVLDLAEGDQYKFSIELLRRWVRQNRPLREVKVEAERVYYDERLYNAGLDLFNRNDLNTATQLFKTVLETKPDHLHARLMLGESFLALGDTKAAILELEKAYALDKEEARMPLARALVKRAQNSEILEDDEDALLACEQVLQIFPEPIAFQVKSRIWTRRGDNALKAHNLEEARNCYLRAENSDKAGVVEQFINSQFDLSPKNKVNYIYSHLVIEHTPPNEYRVSWYQADQVVQTTEKTHSDLKFTLDDWREQLKDCGRTAFDHYLPSKTQKFISTYQNWAVQISTDLADVPWELLHDGQDFLCLSRPVGRKIQLLKEPEKHNYEKGNPLRGLVVGNPTGDLPGAQDEAQAVAEMLEKANVKVDLLNGPEQARAKTFSIKLSNNHYDFIHFAGHGYFNDNEPHLSGLKFQDAIINAGELERGLKSKAFVFLSACEIAQTKAQDSTFGFRGRFIEGLAISALLGGASGCLGPMWPISDGLAKDFALAFYKYLLINKEPIGEAVRFARLEMRDRSPDFWASWVLYGDPLQKLI